MGGLSFCSLKQFINEEIYPIEATSPIKSIMTVINNRREVGYDQLSLRELKILAEHNISYIKVPRVDNLKYYIFYTNEKKAHKLLAISQRHGGKLQDKTFDEAIEIGELLGYNAKSIDDYVYRRYKKHYKKYTIPIISYPYVDDFDET